MKDKSLKEFTDFECQTFSGMASNLFEEIHGSFEKSYINPLIFDQKLKMAPKANNNVYMEPEDVDFYKYKRCYDIRGSYNNGVLKYWPGQFLPIYDGRENIEDYAGGEIDVGEYLCGRYGNIRLCIYGSMGLAYSRKRITLQWTFG